MWLTISQKRVDTLLNIYFILNQRKIHFEIVRHIYYSYSMENFYQWFVLLALLVHLFSFRFLCYTLFFQYFVILKARRWFYFPQFFLYLFPTFTCCWYRFCLHFILFPRQVASYDSLQGIINHCWKKLKEYKTKKRRVAESIKIFAQIVANLCGIVFLVCLCHHWRIPIFSLVSLEKSLFA